MYAFIRKRKNIYIGGFSKEYIDNNVSFAYSLYYILGFLKANKYNVKLQENIFNYDKYGLDLKWNDNCEKYGCKRK